MLLKRLSLLASTLVLTLSLTGCMGGGGPKLPEGDFKIVTQPSKGAVEILLQSADYGSSLSTISSIVLPKDSKYEITVSMEKYADGKLETEKELTKYETSVMKDNAPLNFIANAGKATDKNTLKTILSFSEVDEEKTTDEKDPVYKYSKIYEEPINFDKKVQVEPLGTDLNKEVPMIGYMKFKDDDKDKKNIDLNNYKNEVANYKEVNIIKIKAVKK